jgi:hypothetical protein
VLLAYVSTNDVQSAVARSLGTGAETLNTHVRRIRAKYADAGRPAPTRRDLYVRAIEDGFLPPPSPRRWAGLLSGRSSRRARSRRPADRPGGR